MGINDRNLRKRPHEPTNSYQIFAEFQEDWANLQTRTLNKLVKSMLARCKAVFAENRFWNKL